MPAKAIPMRSLAPGRPGAASALEGMISGNATVAMAIEVRARKLRRLEGRLCSVVGSGPGEPSIRDGVVDGLWELLMARVILGLERGGAELGADEQALGPFMRVFRDDGMGVWGRGGGSRRRCGQSGVVEAKPSGRVLRFVLGKGVDGGGLIH